MESTRIGLDTRLIATFRPFKLRTNTLSLDGLHASKFPDSLIQQIAIFGIGFAELHALCVCARSVNRSARLPLFRKLTVGIGSCRIVSRFQHCCCKCMNYCFLFVQRRIEFGYKRSRRRSRSRSHFVMPITLEQLRSNLVRYGRSFSTFKKGDIIVGSRGMSLSRRYTYTLSVTPGDLSDVDFSPDLTPGEMLMLGVFEGRYLNDCIREFPAEWFVGALAFDSLSPERADPVRCNLFGVKSRQSLAIWRENGWVPDPDMDPAPTPTPTPAPGIGLLGDPNRNPDERGWFQWYCRFWMGRRIPELDAIQIARWKSFRRHAGAIRANCGRGTLSCRPRERQALLQWAYNPFL